MPRTPRSLRSDPVEQAKEVDPTDVDGNRNDADDGEEQRVVTTLPPSKSALKRQMHALQALGERLLDLNPKQLSALPISDAMREALQQHHRIRRGAREGRRRQAQLIGKLMRDEDTAAIAAQLDNERTAHRAQGLTQQIAAQWRDRLVQGPADEASAFQSEFGLPGEMRDLIDRARREYDNDRPPQAQRLLFRRIVKRLSE